MNVENTTTVEAPKVVKVAKPKAKKAHPKASKVVKICRPQIRILKALNCNRPANIDSPKTAEEICERATVSQSFLGKFIALSIEQGLVTVVDKSKPRKMCATPKGLQAFTAAMEKVERLPAVASNGK